MKEKDDFSPDLFVETPRRDNLSEQKPLGKKSAGLLAKTNDRVIHRSEIRIIPWRQPLWRER
jgi:hypothetical protein